jgi:hypothetical protein
MGVQARLASLLALSLIAGFLLNGFLFGQSYSSVAQPSLPVNLQCLPIATHLIQARLENVPLQNAQLNIAVSATGLKELSVEMKSLSRALSAAMGAKSDFSEIITPATSALENSRREIISPFSLKCLDTSPSYANNGVKVYSCNQGLGQTFWMTSMGHVKNGAGNCINGSKFGPVAMSFCSKRLGLRWEVDDFQFRWSFGSVLRNRKTGMCLDVSSDEFVSSSPCDNSCSQRWLISHVGNFTSSEHRRLTPSIRPAHHLGGRILCWVLIESSDFEMAIAINSTWGSFCDILLFVASEDHPGLNVLVFRDAKGAGTLWWRTQQAWMHIYERYIDKADWFFKSDDDTCEYIPYIDLFDLTNLT